MPVPPAPPLDETITPGQLGHIADHEAIADALNNATASITSLTASTAASKLLAGDSLIYVGRGASANDANDGLSVGKPKATIVAAIAALPATGGVVQCLYGNFASFTWTKSNVTVLGLGEGLSTIVYGGAGAAVTTSDPATYRDRNGMADFTIDIRTASAGARGLEVDNMGNGKYRRVLVNGNGVNCKGVNLVGSAAKSTYFNVFEDVDVFSDGTCVQLGNQCNANWFVRGVWQGAGRSLAIEPTAQVTDTCKFDSVAMQSTGAVQVQLGGAGANVSDHMFENCRVEPGPGNPSQIVFAQAGGVAVRNEWKFGSVTNDVTFVNTAVQGNTIFMPTDGGATVGGGTLMQWDWYNNTAPKKTIELRYSGVGITFGNDDKTNWYHAGAGRLATDADFLDCAGFFVADRGGTFETTYGGTTISPNGANKSMYIDSTGTGTVITNGQNGSTGGTQIEASTGGKIGAFGTAPVARPVAADAAIDLATVIALANSLRAGLVAATGMGFFS